MEPGISPRVGLKPGIIPLLQSKPRYIKAADGGSPDRTLMRTRNFDSWTWRAPIDWGGRGMRCELNDHCMDEGLMALNRISPKILLLEKSCSITNPH